VEVVDGAGGDALRDEPRAGLARRWPDQDARRDVVEVGERDHVRGAAPPVVHLREPQPRPVRHQQRPVVRRDPVRVPRPLSPAAAGDPLRELAGQPPLALADQPHHVVHRRARHGPGVRRHAHDVVAVAVEPVRERPPAQRRQRRARVHGEADVHGGPRREPGRAGAGLPRLGDEHLERAAPVARPLQEPGLEVLDVPRRDVHGQVLEAELRRGRERAHRRAGGARDRLAGPRGGHQRRRVPARDVAHGGHELRRAGAVGDGVAEPEAHHEAAARELRHLHCGAVDLDLFRHKANA
jgi:hypothetical protein